jgi:hypothetical protein
MFSLQFIFHQGRSKCVLPEPLSKLCSRRRPFSVDNLVPISVSVLNGITFQICFLFDFRRRHWIFQFTESFHPTQPLTEMSTRNLFLWGKERPVRISSPSVSRLSRKCGILDCSHPCDPQRPATVIVFYTFYFCLCGVVVRVLGYRSGGPGSNPGTARKKSSGSGTGSTQSREYN